ncbi:MAG: HTH domain-containing protein [Candidatus Korarchaeota archaeon]|nr:HTH domain-containing protein [Candidatus Korarchaeota archaeon]
MSSILPEAPKIRTIFYDYLKTRGFPLPINEDPRAEEQLIRSSEGEILRAGRSLDIAMGTISQLLKAASSPISFNSIASSLSISHRTVREYVESPDRAHDPWTGPLLRRVPQVQEGEEDVLQGPLLG